MMPFQRGLPCWPLGLPETFCHFTPGLSWLLQASGQDLLEVIPRAVAQCSHFCSLACFLSCYCFLCLLLALSLPPQAAQVCQQGAHAPADGVWSSSPAITVPGWQRCKSLCPCKGAAQTAPPPLFGQAPGGSASDKFLSSTNVMEKLEHREENERQGTA